MISVTLAMSDSLVARLDAAREEMDRTSAALLGEPRQYPVTREEMALVLILRALTNDGGLES